MARAGKKRAHRWSMALQHRDAFAGIFHMSLVRHVSIARHVVVRTGRTLAGRTKRAPACSLPVSVYEYAVRCGYLSLWGISNLTLACLPSAAATCSEINTAALFDSTPTWRWAVNCDLSLLLQPYS